MTVGQGEFDWSGDWEIDKWERIRTYSRNVLKIRPQYNRVDIMIEMRNKYLTLGADGAGTPLFQARRFPQSLEDLMKMRSPRGAWTFDEPFTEREVELCGEFIQLKLQSRAAAPETHLLPADRPGFSIESTLPLNYKEEADAYALKPTKVVAKGQSSRDTHSKKPSSGKTKAPPKFKDDRPIQCSSGKSRQWLQRKGLQRDGAAKDSSFGEKRAKDNRKDFI